MLVLAKHIRVHPRPRMKTIGASTAPFFQRFARLSRERQPNHNRVRDVVAACRRPGKVIDELHRLEPPEHDERSPGLGRQSWARSRRIRGGLCGPALWSAPHLRVEVKGE